MHMLQHCCRLEHTSSGAAPFPKNRSRSRSQLRCPRAVGPSDADTTRQSKASSAKTTHSKIFEQALRQPISHDLSIDFDRLYITSRCRSWGYSAQSSTDDIESDTLGPLLLYRQHLTLACNDSSIDLLKCCAFIAQHAYPDLDHACLVSHVESLAAEVASMKLDASSPCTLIQAINRVLYSQHGYQGNSTSYYDADNSCMNMVIQERTGNPTMLAILYLEVARRVGLKLDALLLPSHVFLKPQVEGCTYVIDPFNDGQICSLKVLEARLNCNWGLSSPMISLGEVDLQGLRAASKRELLMRLLGNLRESYWGPLPASGLLRWNLKLDADSSYLPLVGRALWVTRFMRATCSENNRLVRDEGYALICLGRAQDGSQLLREYLRLEPGAEDVDKVIEFTVDERT